MHALRTLVVLGLLATVLPLATARAEPDATKKAAVERYLEVSDFDSLVEQTLTQTLAAIRPLLRKQVVDAVRKKGRELPDAVADEIVDVLEGVQWSVAEPIREMTIILYDKHFTVEELEALSTFYSTPVGRSVLKKMPAMTADLVPAIQTMVQQRIREAMPDLVQKIRQAANDKGYEI